MENDLPVYVLKEGLTRRQNACIGHQKKDFQFVVDVHDYIQYINDHPVLDYLFTENLQADPRDLLKKINQLESKAEKEINAIFKRVEKIVKTRKPKNQQGIEAKIYIDFEGRLGKTLDDYNGYKNGRIRSSTGKVPSMFFSLSELIGYTYHQIDPKLVEKYVAITRDRANNEPYINKYTVSKSYEEYERLRDIFKKKSEVSAWGAFDDLSKSYQAVEGYTGNVGKEVEDFMFPKFSPNIFLGSALESLKNKDDGMNILTHDVDEKTVSRLHLALLDELDLYEVEGEKANLKNRRERINTTTLTEEIAEELQPEVTEEGNRGFFKFRRNGAKIFIGKVNTRQYRLVRTLVFPFGANKTVDSVFEEIRIPRDEKDHRLLDFSIAHNRKVELISWAIKELQKVEQLQKKLVFTFSPDNRNTISMKLG